MKTLYKIDFDDDQHPSLCLNPAITSFWNELEHIISEMALKEILNYITHPSYSDDDLEEHKWIKFVNDQLEEKFNEAEMIGDGKEERLKDWIECVCGQYTEKFKLVDKQVNALKK